MPVENNETQKRRGNNRWTQYSIRYRNIKRNQGSLLAGTDDKTISDIAEQKKWKPSETFVSV